MSNEPAAIRLIDEAASALEALGDGWDPPTRHSPVRLQITRRLLPFTSTWVEARAGLVGVTCYPIEPAPQERFLELAEFMNLIAVKGVPFKFALYLPNGVVTLRTQRSFVDTTGDP